MEEKLKYFYSIGNIQAHNIYNKLIELKLINVDSPPETLEEIKKILQKSEIFYLLPEATKHDLLYNPLRIIPREIIELIEKEFKKIIKIRFDICGSYSRLKKESGDIDLVLSTEKKKNDTWSYFMNKINQNSKLIQIHVPFAQGSDKVSVLIEVSGLIGVNVKMDVFLTNDEDYIFAKLFATGSGNFNIRMRALAKRNGFLLNNHGLFNKKTDEKIKINSEEDIFKILGMTYKKPEERLK